MIEGGRREDWRRIGGGSRKEDVGWREAGGRREGGRGGMGGGAWLDGGLALGKLGE